MRKLKPKCGPVTVIHLRTADIIKNPVNPNGQTQPRVNMDEYVISSYYFVNNVEWVIESKCKVLITGHIYKATGKCLQYDEENHKGLIHLIHIQTQDLFNAVIGRKYNMAEVGMVDYMGFRQSASGYIFGNTIQLDYAQNAAYFRVEKEFKPYFELGLREW